MTPEEKFRRDIPESHQRLASVLATHSIAQSLQGLAPEDVLLPADLANLPEWARNAKTDFVRQAAEGAARAILASLLHEAPATNAAEEAMNLSTALSQAKALYDVDLPRVVEGVSEALTKSLEHIVSMMQAEQNGVH